MRTRIKQLLLDASLWLEASVASPSIGQRTKTDDTAPQNLTLTSQAPFAAATGVNRTAGRMIVTVPAAVGGGAESSFGVSVAGNENLTVTSTGVSVSSLVVADSGTFRPEDYGAIGDGVADDTVALQAAIDAALAHGLGIVLLSGKPYLHTSALNVHTGRLTIRGVGYETISAAKFDVLDTTYKLGTTGSRLISDGCSAFTRDNASGYGYLRLEHFVCIGNTTNPAFNFGVAAGPNGFHYQQYYDVGAFNWGVGFELSLTYHSVWTNCRANGCQIGFRLGLYTDGPLNGNGSGGGPNEIFSVDVSACDVGFALREGSHLNVIGVLAQQDIGDLILLQPSGNNVVTHCSFTNIHFETDHNPNRVLVFDDADAISVGTVKSASDISISEIHCGGVGTPGHHAPFVWGVGSGWSQVIRLTIRNFASSSATVVVPNWIQSFLAIGCQFDSIDVTAVASATLISQQTVLGGYGALTTTAFNTKRTALGTSTSTSALFENTTPALVGTPVQVSPAAQWDGTAWNLTAVAASNNVRFRAHMVPVSAAAPYGQWKLYTSVDTGVASWSEVFSAFGGSLPGVSVGGVTVAISSAGQLYLGYGVGTVNQVGTVINIKPAGGAAAFQFTYSGSYPIADFAAGQYRSTSKITPSALAAGVTQNYSPTGMGSALHVWLTSNVASSQLGGILPNAVDQELILHNDTTGVLVLNHEDVGSTAAWRFSCPNAVAWVISAGGSVHLHYDGTLSRWTILNTGSSTLAGVNVALVGSTTVTANASKIARGAQVFRYPGVAGIVGQSTNLDSYVAIGAIIIDPSEMFAGDADLARTVTLEFLLETTLAAAVATVQLYNVDDAEALVDSGAAASWTSTSLTAQRVVSASLTVGAAAGNLKNALKTYEVQLKRNGSTDAQYVTCKLAQLKFRYA